MKTNNVSNQSKIERCPNCSRVLCHSTTVGDNDLLHLQHKGFECGVPEAIVKCMSCDNKYWINSLAGVINEVTIDGT